MGPSSYRDLKVWQRAMDMVIECYEQSRCLPREERYGLTSQLRRAAVSVPANIAEGRSRRGKGDFGKHLSIAAGSLAEVETLLEIAERVEYLDHPTRTRLSDTTSEVGRMIYGLYRSLGLGPGPGRTPVRNPPSP